MQKHRYLTPWKGQIAAFTIQKFYMYPADIVQRFTTVFLAALKIEETYYLLYLAVIYLYFVIDRALNIFTAQTDRFVLGGLF